MHKRRMLWDNGVDVFFPDEDARLSGEEIALKYGAIFMEYQRNTSDAIRERICKGGHLTINDRGILAILDNHSEAFTFDNRYERNQWLECVKIALQRTDAEYAIAAADSVLKELRLRCNASTIWGE